MITEPSEFCGYVLFDKDINHLPSLPRMTINTINQYSFCVAENDPEFKSALKESDVLLPDGIGIIAAVKLITGRLIKKISGSDMHLHLLKMLNDNHLRCFYLGSSQQTLDKIKERLHVEYPNIESFFYSPPFKPNFSDEENWTMIEKINAVQPHVVFVGMTAPKQEKWVKKNKHLIDTRIICSIGAVFDFYGGVVTRPSNFWINLGLEWFIRLCKEPKRMWKRYIYYGPVFVHMLFKERMKNPGLSKISPDESV